MVLLGGLVLFVVVAAWSPHFVGQLSKQSTLLGLLLLLYQLFRVQGGFGRLIQDSIRFVVVKFLVALERFIVHGQFRGRRWLGRIRSRLLIVGLQDNGRRVGV